MEEYPNDFLSQRQEVQREYAGPSATSSISFPLLIESAKFGGRYFWSGDNLRKEEMDNAPILTFKFKDCYPSRQILVLTHCDKSFPELGEYLHWVGLVSNSFETSRVVGDLITYQPPVKGDPPFLYTLTLYAEYKRNQLALIQGLPCVDRDRQNFNSEHFAILNKLEAIDRIHFRA